MPQENLPNGGADDHPEEDERVDMSILEPLLQAIRDAERKQGLQAMPKEEIDQRVLGLLERTTREIEYVFKMRLAQAERCILLAKCRDFIENEIAIGGRDSSEGWIMAEWYFRQFYGLSYQNTGAKKSLDGTPRSQKEIDRLHAMVHKAQHRLLENGHHW